MKDKRRSDLTFEGMTFVQIASGQENVWKKNQANAARLSIFKSDLF